MTILRAAVLCIMTFGCARPHHVDSVAGAQDSAARWTGYFSAHESGRRGPMFEVTLTPGHRGEWLGLARYGQGLPQPGRYSLGILDKSKSGEFYATYIRHGRLPSDTNYAYVSVAGELIVAHSSPQLVEGRLHFTGAEYSAVSPAGRSGSGSPDKIEPNAPTIDVSASFSAIPISER